MTVDFEFLASEAVTLLGTTKVKGALASVPVAGFSTVGSCRIDVGVDSIRGTGIRSVTLIVEDSPNGSVWSTVHSWTFSEPGTGSFQPSSLQDQVRVRFTTAGGLREATVGGVVVVPARDASVSGGSQPITREELSSNGVTIDDADGAWMPWDTSGGPDVLIDRSVPAHPTIITAGVYLVSVSVACIPAMTADGYFNAGLHLDRDGFNASTYARSSSAGLSPANGVVSDVPLAFAWYIPAGNQIGVFVDNHDGNAARGFGMIYAHIQRLS